MGVLQQQKLSIEESHGAKDGHAQGGGENNFVKHLFLLVYDLVLGQMISIFSSCSKSEWSNNRPPCPLSTQGKSNPNPDPRRRGRLLGGRRWRWAEAHPEGAVFPSDTSLISLVVNIAAIRY